MVNDHDDLALVTLRNLKKVAYLNPRSEVRKGHENLIFLFTVVEKKVLARGPGLRSCC